RARPAEGGIGACQAPRCFMNCSPFDLRDYAFDELTERERREVELHVRTCEGCHEEVQRLRLTQSALLALRDEEVPQGIALVSDKVFEPSPLRRWLRSFWSSGARLGFASAAMLSAALVFSAVISAWTRPAPVIPPPATASIEAEVSRRIQKAVAESEE